MEVSYGVLRWGVPQLSRKNRGPAKILQRLFTTIRGILQIHSSLSK